MKTGKKHQYMLKLAKELSKGDFLIDIPDIVEGLDILAAMRGPQNMCFDLIDRPDVVKEYINQLDELYFIYYDVMYDIVKDDDGSSSFTSFHVWGPGRTAKLQCDFSALISPDQFREFVLPSLSKQCKKLDTSLYHLDGLDAVRHIDALMEIKELDILHWIPGPGYPDSGSEHWYPLYDKVIKADKLLWLRLKEGTPLEQYEKVDRMVKRYGPERLFIEFTEMNQDDAKVIITRAEKNWRGSKW